MQRSELQSKITFSERLAFLSKMWYRVHVMVKWIVSGLMMIGFLAGCASPTAQPFLPAMQTPALHKDSIIVSDGASLALSRWLPENEPRAVLVGLHGFNDYSNSYTLLGESLAEQGIAVYAYDQRGYGRSPAFGIWAGKENLLRDVGDVVRAVRDVHPQTPLYVMGESMGGAVTLMAAKEGKLPADVSGLILSAPAVWGGKTMKWFYRLPLWVAVHTFPSARVGGKNLGIRPSDNIQMLNALSRDPLVIKRSRMDSLYGIVSLMDTAYMQADALPFPTLVLYGAQDQIIPKAPTLAILNRMRHARIAYYPDGFHMLTRDLQAAVVHGDIAEWIENPTAPLPSGGDREVGSRLSEDMRSGKK
jgi:acylglycerol lipase